MTDTMTTTQATSLQSLEVLYEAQELSPDLPHQLQTLYGGPLGITPGVYANFVATLDGVVALPEVPGSNKIISDSSQADRFVMGLLRATADVVLIGSGTLHSSRHGRWTAEHAYPPAARAYAELRRNRDLPRTPLLAVLTGSGNINPGHPALEEGALVLTTARGAEALRSRLPSASSILSLGEGPRPNPARALDALRQRGHRHILSEAGPHVFGTLLAAGIIDELFLTSSPLLAGHSPHGSTFSLVEGTQLLPHTRVEGQLLSVRRHTAHLFLRYAFPSGSRADGPGRE
ncbi:dihydrofolate reductase family protein [Micromonospora sp. NPDC005806]|uniref:dihydrofolate reductase family protein n=1 Tax=Micromonospora sp. NPDC005806 TaxID=3364234 RepID=UPI0036C95FD1